MPKIKRYKGVRQLPDGRFLVRYPELARKYHERILERHEAETLENAIGMLDGLRAKVQTGARPWERVAPEAVTTFNMLADDWLNYSRIHLKAYVQDVYLLKTLMELGGWSSLEMVEIYAHVADEHKAEAIKRLDAYSGSKIWSNFGVAKAQEALAS
ncbi:MAG: hypothetical protein HYT87_13235 [Nitrospirae bacterium]|nr:hypothetical protein [Nitrospirota bacterium]